MSISLLIIYSFCAAEAINDSFEKGEDAPAGWSLSEGTGEWEKEGYTGERSISVTGDGENSNYWKFENPGLEPGKIYRISFASKVSPDSSEGTVITGSNAVNRDFSIGTEWEKRSFVFTAPDNVSGTYLRFGQWHKSGKVWFDNINLTPVFALHNKNKALVLGEGEVIQNDTYKFRANLRGEGSNSSRNLYSHTAGFNSYRWLMGTNSEVIYRQKVNNYKQKKASVTVGIGYYQRGICEIQTSINANDWKTIGVMDKVSHETFNVPDEMLPAEEVYVRLVGQGTEGEPASLQIHNYSYKADLIGTDIPDMVGDTRYIDIIAASDQLDVELISLGSLKPGEANSVKLKVMNDLGLPINASLKISGTEEYENSAKPDIAEGETKIVEIPYEIHKSGEFELTISIDTPYGETLYSTRTYFQVPQLYAADYGYLLGKSDDLSIWWAESTYKISRERPVPEKKADEIYISAARNEYEPFQLVLRSEKDLQDVSIEIGELRTMEGHIIPTENIEISTVGYVYVKIPTDRVGCVGYWPDPLPPYKGSLSLKADQNQPLWINVYVPPHATAGDYRGKLTVKADSWSQQFQLHLHVWRFSLAKESHVRSAMGFSVGNVKKYHHLETEEELRQVLDKYYESFSKHRISPYNAMQLDPIKVDFSDDQVKIDFEAFDRSAEKYFDEMGFTSFRMPLYGMGGGTFHSRRLGEINGHKQGTPEHERLFTEYLSQVEKHLEQKGWLEHTFVYWFDEPSPKDYEFVNDGMSLIHRAAPKITRLLTEQPESELFGSVDIWCPVTSSYNHEKAEERRKEGESFWWYVCTGPKEPYVTLFIDHFATEMRLWLWQTWKYKLKGILVWQTNYWTSGLVFPDPDYQNPYEDPMSYQTGYGRPVGYIGYWGNGDGRFIYPPVEAMESDEKCFAEPVSSFRWEMLREGIEDFEYFWILAERIKKAKEKPEELIAEAKKLLNLPENIVKNMTDFTVDPEPMFSHRERIARMIEELE
ncbi:DUF4091 domain-containing protein [Candidatus Poribacteria bacterium]|nr:DUF4091 domain-containing protein [Candidatus Poribacteria bacterium]